MSCKHVYMEIRRSLPCLKTTAKKLSLSNLHLPPIRNSITLRIVRRMAAENSKTTIRIESKVAAVVTNVKKIEEM